MNNNPNPFGQQPNRPLPPQPPRQPGAPIPPPVQSGAPIPPQPLKKPVDSNEILGIISCISGIASIGLGILSAVMSNNIYGIFGAMPSSTLVAANITAGPSPVFALIVSIVALLLGIAGAVLGLAAGNANLRTGAPRGKWATLGLIFGCAGALICIVAVFFTSCASCSFCSLKEQANGTASSLSRLF